MMFRSFILKSVVPLCLLFLAQYPALAQLKCTDVMKTQALDYIRSEEAGGRNHGECGLQYQLFEENKCHAWTAALWDPMLYEAKQCAKKYNEIVCVHNIAVLLPGSHNYIGVTVSKDGYRSEGLTVDGWRCDRSNQSLRAIDWRVFYEMPPLYDSGDDKKRFTFNINQPGNPKKKPVGHMVSKGGTPTWEPAWIEADGIEIGAEIECFGGTPTPTHTPTAAPATRTPTKTPTKTGTSTPFFTATFTATPEGSGTPGGTPSPSPSPTPQVSPTPTPYLSPTPTPRATPTNNGGATATPCPTKSGNSAQKILPCEGVVAELY